MTQPDWISELKKSLLIGDLPAAKVAFRNHIRQDPIFLYRKSSNPSAIKVLRLVPGEAATPHSLNYQGAFSVSFEGVCEADHFLDSDEFETQMFHILNDTDVRTFVSKASSSRIILNAISDPDCHEVALKIAADACYRLSIPILNDPAIVLRHRRDHLSQAASNIDGLRVPMTARKRSGTKEIHGIRFPMIARVAGTHTGVSMQLIRDNDALVAFEKYNKDKEIYLSEFVDFQSPDGWYRKYRASVVGGEIFPNHLFCDRTWNVHGRASRQQMLRNERLLEEEAHYVEQPLNKTHRLAFEELHKKIGVDFYGIDYAILPDGRALLFEANASMRSDYPEWRESFPITASVTSGLVSHFRRQIFRKIESVVARVSFDVR